MRRPDAKRVDPILLALSLFAVVTPLTFPALGAGPVAFWLLVTAVNAGFVWLAPRVAALHPAQRGFGPRRLWQTAVLAGVWYLVGDIMQIVEVARGPTTPSAVLGSDVQMVLMAAGTVTIVVGLLLVPVGDLNPHARSRLRMDVATVMAGAATFGLWLVELPPGPRDLGWAVGLATKLMVEPGMFLVMIFAVVKIVLSGRAQVTRRTALLLGAAAVLQTVLQVIPDAAYLSPDTQPWLLGANILPLTLAAIGARVEEGQVRRKTSSAANRPGRPYSVLPYVAMGATWLLTVFVLAGSGLDRDGWVVGGGALATTALVVGRQMAAFRHIAELLRERDELAARLHEMAFHDGLTGLPNRAMFMRRLRESLAAGPVTVFLIDLDGFKPVNDEYGHAAGDRLLVETGNRLRAAVRSGDTVARLGGDEFAVLAPGLDHDPRRRADLIAAVHARLRIGDADVSLRASIGMAQGRTDPDRLLHEADMAMYAQKREHPLARR
jgi:diguanylate cyclase